MRKSDLRDTSLEELAYLRDQANKIEETLSEYPELYDEQLCSRMITDFLDELVELMEMD